MGVGIRLENLRKVYDTPPPSQARGAAFSFVHRRRGPKEKKKYEVVALDGISLEISAGEMFGLLGPNGAGKSTTIGVLTTRTRPTSGTAFVGDYNVWTQQVQAKRLIGVVQQRPNLDFSLTAREILLFHGKYFCVPDKENQRRATELLEKFKLTDRADQPLLGFSGGMMQRVSIARAMMHDPQVLFLDEPSAGLDPISSKRLDDLILELRDALGATIIVVTHELASIFAIADNAVFLDAETHTAIARGNPRQLLRDSDSPKVREFLRRGEPPGKGDAP